MSGCRTRTDLAETRLARLTRLRCTQVPGNAKHINLRWRLPNNGAFAAAAQQPADHLAEYRAAHASEAEAQERGQLHGWGAEREPMLQVECMKERTRADELALELERANARNQELQLRIDTLVRDLALRTLRTDEPEASGLHGDVAGEQRTLQEQLAVTPTLTLTLTLTLTPTPTPTPTLTVTKAIDLSGVSINFEMYRGEFNINGFMRILTEGEVRAALPRGLG